MTYLVSVLYDYIDERAENIIIDLHKIPEGHPHRIAIEAALCDDNTVTVPYDLMEDFDFSWVVESGFVKDSVIMYECSGREETPWCKYYEED